jgi:phosphoribosylaminoimidazole-succinocarboxamide synthase
MGTYNRTELLYEGKAKKVFGTDADGVYIVEYKDNATAGNGAKKGVIAGKGAVNNRVTNCLMRLLEGRGIPTHFIEELDDVSAAVRRVEIVPLEVIVRNIAAGSLAARLGLAEGTKLGSPVLEYCYKNDALGDPMVNEYHIAAMEWATRGELETIADYSFRANSVLTGHLRGAGIELIDFKLEFGRADDGKIILADEISPDTCRFWDIKTGEKLDKDRFRRDLGGVEDAYREVARRLLAQD